WAPKPKPPAAGGGVAPPPPPAGGVGVAPPAPGGDGPKSISRGANDPAPRPAPGPRPSPVVQPGPSPTPPPPPMVTPDPAPMPGNVLLANDAEAIRQAMEDRGYWVEMSTDDQGNPKLILSASRSTYWILF